MKRDELSGEIRAGIIIVATLALCIFAFMVTAGDLPL